MGLVYKIKPNSGKDGIPPAELQRGPASEDGDWRVRLLLVDQNSQVLRSLEFDDELLVPDGLDGVADHLRLGLLEVVAVRVDLHDDVQVGGSSQALKVVNFEHLEIHFDVIKNAFERQQAK